MNLGIELLILIRKRKHLWDHPQTMSPLNKKEGVTKISFGAIYKTKSGTTGGGREINRSKIRGGVIYVCYLKC